MKSFLIAFLAVAVVVLGFSVSSLQKELLGARNNSAFYDKRSEDLQRELMRVNRILLEKERFSDEIEQNIVELESKVDLQTLEKYVPKNTWSEIKPIIDRLKALQQEREAHNPSRENEEDN